MIENFTNLKDKVLFTIFCLIIYRFGCYIPLPGVDAVVMAQVANANSSGILGMFNMLSGGSLGRMAIFALAIMPYITSSIVMQLLAVLVPHIENLKKEGASGRKTINQYTRYLTVLLTMVQGFGVAYGLEMLSFGGKNVVLDPGIMFRVSAVASLVGGTVFLMWLGEQITARGVGNGISLIIFTGIVAGLPSALISVFELTRTGAMNIGVPIIVLLLLAVMFFLIVFVEKSNRPLMVHYPKRQVGNKMYSGQSNMMPLRINVTGVIAPIFASAVLLFPLTVANFTANSNGILATFAGYLAHGRPLYIVLYVVLIMFFAFFYTSIVFNPEDTANNIKKQGGYILGVRPGKDTIDYIEKILMHLTCIGGLYMSFICVVPEVLLSKYSFPFSLGGTSLLIVVTVVLDTVYQIQGHIFSVQYESVLKKGKKKGLI